jgi:hypothetical protein
MTTFGSELNSPAPGREVTTYRGENISPAPYREVTPFFKLRKEPSLPALRSASAGWNLFPWALCLLGRNQVRSPVARKGVSSPFQLDHYRT